MAFFANGYFSDMVYEKKDWNVQVVHRWTTAMQAATGEDRRRAERRQCGPDRIPLPRRKADSVSRLERSGYSRSQHRELLPERH